MNEIRFDFNNMFSRVIGEKHGVSPSDLSKEAGAIAKAHKHLRGIIADERNRINLNLEWVRLPFQEKRIIDEIVDLAKEVSSKYENVIFLGIGGSYLGLKAAQEALCPAYYNEFASLRKAGPRIYFEGNNLDPDTLRVLIKNLNPKKTFVIVISKSGETTETRAAFTVLEEWLRKGVGKLYGRQIAAITDPIFGALRKKVNQEQKEDILSFRNLPLQRGVGGRFSELNMGLLHLAIAGVNIQELLDGAKAMAKKCEPSALFKNPAYMYAALHTVLYRDKKKSIAVMMPFSETLKSTSDWYSQLLAESLGKKYARIIKIKADGTEEWLRNKNRAVNIGRTPVACRGTNDLHSIQQNNIEGENDKAVTFIRVEKFNNDIFVPGKGDIISGRSLSELIKLAQEATEWALVKESRPNCTITLPAVTPFYWGGLIYFFEMATAFEGELLGINAFDQPGVEGYKNYMYYKLNKPELPKEVAEEIRKSPLVKSSKYII